MNEKVKAYLYPNPPLKGEILKNVWGNSFKMENKPSLEIELFNFSSGKYFAEVLSPIKLKKDVSVTSSYQSVYFFHTKLADPNISEVRIVLEKRGTKKEFILPLSVHKISGRVRDFSGRSFPSYLWATKEDDANFKSIIKTDKTGKFDFYYPEGKKLKLFIDDKSYSKDTLECWVMANTIKNDLRINPRVGNFELYGLQVWLAIDLCYVFFVPASLSLVKLEKKSNWKKRFPPKLKKREIKVFINEEKAEIKELVELPTFGKVYYPSYLIITKPKRKLVYPVIIRVEIDSSEKGRGEAWYIYY